MASLPTSVAVPPAAGLSLVPATELLALLRARDVSAVELLDAVLRRADAVTPTVNPFAVRLDERAFAAAAESDRRIAAGTARPLGTVIVVCGLAAWICGTLATHDGEVPFERLWRRDRGEADASEAPIT